MWMADRCCNIIGKSGNFERKTPMEKPITAQTFEYPQKERFGAGGKLGPFGMGQMKFTRDQIKLPLCFLDQILETLCLFLSDCCWISRFDETLYHCQPCEKIFLLLCTSLILKMMA